MIQDHLKKIVSSHYEEGEAPVEFVSTVEEHYHRVFISAEYQIETLQSIKIMVLKALHEQDCGHELQQCLRFLAVTQINLETQIKTLKNIVDEKQIGIKEAIKIVSSLNGSRKLLVSEVLKLVVLILLVPTTNAVSERSCSTLCKVQTYL